MSREYSISFPRFLVSFCFNGSLDEVATLCSESLFAGLPFCDGDGCRDEFPAKKLARNFLGMKIVLWKTSRYFTLEGIGDSIIGYPKDTDFKKVALEHFTHHEVGEEIKHCDLGEYVSASLRHLDGVENIEFFLMPRLK